MDETKLRPMVRKVLHNPWLMGRFSRGLTILNLSNKDKKQLRWYIRKP